jgi:hypothetical protein
VNYSIQITKYSLAVFPYQTIPGISSPLLAELTVDGTKNTTAPPASFVIQFFGNGVSNLTPPKEAPGGSRVIIQMHESQLAGVLALIDRAILASGPACSAIYTDGPAPTAQIAVSAP